MNVAYNMDCIDAFEAAYRNGYEAGKADAIMERQKRVKPKITFVSLYGTVYKCRECGTWLKRSAKPNYCHKCGQGIEWRGIDE